MIILKSIPRNNKLEGVYITKPVAIIILPKAKVIRRYYALKLEIITNQNEMKQKKKNAKRL